MRPLALFAIFLVAVSLPSGADAKKKKDDPTVGKLSCKQLSGRMQVTIMRLRGFGDQKQGSVLSRGIQSGLSATFGNLSHGADPQGEYESSLKQLRDYNQELVDKGCKSYDLDAELAKKEIDDVPAPTVPAQKKKAKAPAAAAASP